MYTITQIEDAILATLRDNLPNVETCESLGEFLSSNIEEDRLLSLRRPAVYVIYERGRYSHKMSGVQQRDMIFRVVAMLENLRGDAAARRGAASEAGAYDVLESIRAALTGNQCGLAIDPLLPLHEEAISGNSATAVYGISFKTGCRFIL